MSNSDKSNIDKLLDRCHVTELAFKKHDSIEKLEIVDGGMGYKYWIRPMTNGRYKYTIEPDDKKIMMSIYEVDTKEECLRDCNDHNKITILASMLKGGF